MKSRSWVAKASPVGAGSLTGCLGKSRVLGPLAAPPPPFAYLQMSLVYRAYSVPCVLAWSLRAVTECQHLSETARGHERQSHKDDGTHSMSVSTSEKRSLEY